MGANSNRCMPKKCDWGCTITWKGANDFDHGQKAGVVVFFKRKAIRLKVSENWLLLSIFWW